MNGPYLIPGPPIAGDIILSGSIGSGSIANAAVASGQIASGCIGSVHIQDGTIITVDIASGQVQSGQLGSGSVVNAGIASGAVQGLVGTGIWNIASGTLAGFELGSGAIVSGRIASGQVGNFHIASGQIKGQGGAGVFNIASGTVGRNDLQSGLLQAIPVVRQVADLLNSGTSFTSGLLSNLSVTMVSGHAYTGRLVAKANNAAAAEGIKFDFNGGTATASAFWAAASELVGGTTVLGTAISTALNGVINYTTITGETVIEVFVSMVCSATGTFIPRVAENANATGCITLELGSWLRMEDSSN